jgi:TIR domain-containing protein
VWYDRFVLRLGDSLRRKIDEGLAQSRYGVVILSPHFFAKEWPQKELDGLVAREDRGVKVILPIWHRIDKDGVLAQSPTLADRVAARTKDGLDEVVRQVVDELGPPSGRAKSTRPAAQTSTPATPVVLRPPAPARAPVAEAPPSPGAAPASASDTIKVIGVDERGISRPSNDGSQGSALYRIPLKLSRPPSSLWGRAFEQMWNQPFVPGGSLRHRPGIASVVGDTIVLDGTTIEEVQEAHLTTVKNVIAEVNEKVLEFERRERERMDREAEAEGRRQTEIRDRIDRMRFD